MDVPVFCPRPRRIARIDGGADGIGIGIKQHHWAPMMIQQQPQLDLTDSEDLDIVPPKDYYYGGLDKLSGSLVSSSPPYFSGSPPIRTTNPIVNDARFLEEKRNNTIPLTPHPPFISPQTSPISLTPSTSSRKGGFARQTTKFGSNNQETVRIEGFDCLNIDTPGRGIPAFA